MIRRRFISDNGAKWDRDPVELAKSLPAKKRAPSKRKKRAKRAREAVS